MYPEKHDNTHRKQHIYKTCAFCPFKTSLKPK